jgi:hypothetical protein
MNATDVNLVVDKVAGLLEKVADKIGVAADKVWPWLVKQQVLEGSSLLVLFLIGAVGTFFTVKGCGRWWGESTRMKENDSFSNKDEKEITVFSRRLMYTVGAIIFALVALVTGIEFINIGAWKLFNPEYFALMDLISAAK